MKLLSFCFFKKGAGQFGQMCPQGECHVEMKPEIEVMLL